MKTLLSLISFLLATLSHRSWAQKYPDGQITYDNAHYQFEWQVQDDYSGNNFGQNEERYNDNTQGSYYVLLPDGRTQTVTYRVDGYGGFVADVNYQGEAKAYTYQPRPSASYQQPRFQSAPVSALKSNINNIYQANQPESLIKTRPVGQNNAKIHPKPAVPSYQAAESVPAVIKSYRQPSTQKQRAYPEESRYQPEPEIYHAPEKNSYQQPQSNIYQVPNNYRPEPEVYQAPVHSNLQSEPEIYPTPVQNNYQPEPEIYQSPAQNNYNVQPEVYQPPITSTYIEPLTKSITTYNSPKTIDQPKTEIISYKPNKSYNIIGSNHNEVTKSSNSNLYESPKSQYKAAENKYVEKVGISKVYYKPLSSDQTKSSKVYYKPVIRTQVSKPKIYYKVSKDSSKKKILFKK